MSTRALGVAGLLVAGLALSACAAGPQSPAGTADPDLPTIIAVVGTAENPDEYRIAVTDEDGAPIAELAAGEYNLRFADRSAMHNVRIEGPGLDELATSVEGEDTSIVQVALEPGTYRYVCDPHAASMSGTLLVSG